MKTSAPEFAILATPDRTKVEILRRTRHTIWIRQEGRRVILRGTDLGTFWHPDHPGHVRLYEIAGAA